MTNLSYQLSLLGGYHYLGYTYPNVPEPWRPIVLRLIRDIDRLVRPWYIPRIPLNIINALATNGSVVRVRSRFWLHVLDSVTKGVRIHDIKDKYAGLRVYGSFTDAIQALVDKAEEDCYNTCEKCGSHDNVQVCGEHWVYSYCGKCRRDKLSPSII
jgi:hypothetical protein